VKTKNKSAVYGFHLAVAGNTFFSLKKIVRLKTLSLVWIEWKLTDRAVVSIFIVCGAAVSHLHLWCLPTDQNKRGTPFCL